MKARDILIEYRQGVISLQDVINRVKVHKASRQGEFEINADIVESICDKVIELSKKLKEGKKQFVELKINSIATQSEKNVKMIKEFLVFAQKNSDEVIKQLKRYENECK